MADDTYTTADYLSYLEDPKTTLYTAKSEACAAKSATECASDATCDFQGQCGVDGVYLMIWLGNECPTMANVLAKLFKEEGVTQAEIHEEANAAGITVSPSFQAALDAEGVSSDAARISWAMSTVAAALLTVVV